MFKQVGRFLFIVAILITSGAALVSISSPKRSDKVIATKSPTAMPAVQMDSPIECSPAAALSEPVKHEAPMAVCFAEGTSQDYIDDVQASVLTNSLTLPPDPDDPSPRYVFTDSNRWPGALGNPTTLTWSLMPDGLTISSGGIPGEVAGPNEMFARMDSLFATQGGRATWINRINQSFDRWHQLTGITYVRIQFNGTDWDDGAAFGANGAAGLRGDIRIGMKPIDGNSNVLAYTYFPTNGDMVFDRAESWNSTANANRLFRNTFMHEHGHGIGFDHVCPANGVILMEPFLNTNFDGPQQDDVRAGQRAYGDVFESNDTPATATNMGTIVQGSPNTGKCTAPLPTNGTAVANASLCSIETSGDVDYYKFTATASVVASVTITPIGTTYFSNVQNSNCTGSNQVNALAVANLNVQIIAADGTTVIATGAAQPAGSAESLSGIPVSGTPGIFYVKVYTTSSSQSQLYSMSISVNNTGADLAAPQPNPMTFDEPPHGISTSEISMTATIATDATPPIMYQFHFVVGSAGGGPDSPFQSSPVFVDSGLNPNASYSYQVQSRDNASPTANQGSYSTQVTAYTLIQTPTGVNFGAVTDNSIVVQAAGTFSFITSLSSGIYFDSLTPGGDEGLNEWVQTSPPVSATATSLQPNTTYEFRCKARNRTADETPFGPSGSKTTLAVAPDAPILSNATNNSMQIDVSPGANPVYTELAIQCTQTNPADANWQGKYVDVSGNPQAVESWQTDAQWGLATIHGLQTDTEYTFAVKARNLDSIQTAFGPTATLGTSSSPITDCNNNEVDDATEIAGNPALDCNNDTILDECQGVGAPNVSGQPTAQNLCSGHTATYTVVASGTPAVSYQWRIGTTVLNDGPTGNGSTISGATTDTLQISNASAADAASNYNCLVSNTCGSVPSDDAALSVFLSGGGDVNGDTLIDGLDIQGFIDAALSGGPASASYCAADMNADGTVDEVDADLLVAALMVP